MIGSPVKLNITDKSKDLKLRDSFALSGEVSETLRAESVKNNLSRSEIVEFAIRKLLKLDTNISRNILNIIYKE